MKRIRNEIDEVLNRVDLEVARSEASELGLKTELRLASVHLLGYIAKSLNSIDESLTEIATEVSNRNTINGKSRDL